MSRSRKKRMLRLLNEKQIEKFEGKNWLSWLKKNVPISVEKSSIRRFTKQEIVKAMLGKEEIAKSMMSRGKSGEK